MISMKIGIISDSHDDITNVNKAIEIFEEMNVESIIHAGDIISPPIIKEFKKLTESGVKLFAVFGNNDGEKKGLKSAINSIGGNLLGDIGKIEIAGLKFCIYHGQDLKKKEKIINSEKFDVFVYGHSHTKDPKYENDVRIGNKTIVMNPGSSHSAARSNFSEPPYFPNPSIIIFDSITKKIEFVNL